MKKIILYSIIIIGLIYMIVNFLIGSNLVKFNNFLSSDQRNLIKSVIFPYKYISQLENIIRSQSYTQGVLINEIENLKNNFFIKTDGLESFNLTEKNKIYFYSGDVWQYYNINLKGINKKTKLDCFNSTFIKDFVIRLENLPVDCKKSLFFIGELSLKDNANQKLFFYFAINQKKLKSDNLLVLPTTNFYNYSSNIYEFNQYTSSVNYIANLSEIPTKSKMIWAEMTADSIINISKNLFDNFNVILDYELEEHNLDKYKIIIFPMHQEYISNNIMNKLINFLKKDDNKKILSIGGANFWRTVELNNVKKTYSITYPKDEFIDNDFYQISTIDKKIKDCVFKDNKNLKLGEISLYKKNKNRNNQYFFFNIECKNNKNIPLLSVTQYDDNGKLIHLMTDGIGLRFNEILYLREKLYSLLN